ncbi:probable pectinesterase/pectinesterase inhibitor 36 [Ziziphus jujuba]|uniref:Pectinesterase n=1 Tax=Ziziphus jujuba TaxID=326968 RepID=A0A6P3YZF9_ZIZJJ|nr:probable pectinesterase/pectinesterase inhibitor 36 [Ziziphus jujuba]
MHFVTSQSTVTPSLSTMSTSSSVATLLFLLAFATTSFSSLPHLQLLDPLLLISRNMVLQSMSLRRLVHTTETSSIGVALRDCTKLYDESEPRLARLISGENYTGDDARTWLSGVLANHRSCLDGLAEKGFGEAHLHFAARNLTTLLGQALALYGKRINGRGKRVPRGQRSAHDRNGGLLVSWNAGTSKAHLVVAKDGSGTHRSINEAVFALRRMGQSRPYRAIVYVKSGVYNEKVEIPRNLNNVMFVGDGIDRTIVTGSRNVPDGDTTLSSATFGVSGDGFWARDMTFENTAGPQKHQAVALRVSSDLSVFYRCSVKAYQDTLYVHSLRQFYRDCHIYGTVDFIFGDAPVVIQNCDIFVRTPMSHQANMVTAQGRDNPHENTGISIHGSRIKPAADFMAVKGSFRSYLGRPWKKYSRTIVVNTDLDGLIDPRGWTEWSGSFALSTLFYAEYMNTGIGASTAKRVNWPGFHVFSSHQEASPFMVSNFIQGGMWIPATGVPVWLGV